MFHKNTEAKCLNVNIETTRFYLCLTLSVDTVNAILEKHEFLHILNFVSIKLTWLCTTCNKPFLKVLLNLFLPENQYNPFSFEVLCENNCLTFKAPLLIVKIMAVVITNSKFIDINERQLIVVELKEMKIKFLITFFSHRGWKLQSVPRTSLA